MRKMMKTLKTKEWVNGIVCLVAAVLLITAHAAGAQEVRIGGITISIPKRAKTRPKS